MELAKGRELAQRLESIEASVSEACVEAVLGAQPNGGATVQRIAGGRVFFFGPMSPLSQAVGIGMEGPVSEDEFDRLEGFFLARNAPISISLCPYADPSALERLASRRYRITHFEHTMFRLLSGDESFLAPPQAIVRQAQAGEERLWSTTVMEGFQEGLPAMEGLADLFALLFSAPGSTCYLALQDGQAAGGATLSLHDEAAMFYSDSTLPRFRRRGLHSALIAARLRHASAAGCRLAVACTAPGSTSHRNYEEAGFNVAYTKAILVRDGYTIR